MLDTRDFTDRPFGLPPDIVLDIPLPPSVNRTRKIDHAAAAMVETWKRRTDLVLMAHGQYRAAKKAALDRFEITIILNEDCRMDLDNPVKAAIDYLRRIEVIPNDDKRHLRRLVVEWGEAPEGCRLVLREMAA